MLHVYVCAFAHLGMGVMAHGTIWFLKISLPLHSWVTLWKADQNNLFWLQWSGVCWLLFWQTAFSRKDWPNFGSSHTYPLPLSLYPRPTLGKLMTPRSNTESSAVTSPSFRWLFPLSDWFIPSPLLNLQPGPLQVGRVRAKWALIPVLWTEFWGWESIIHSLHAHQTTSSWMLLERFTCTSLLLFLVAWAANCLLFPLYANCACQGCCHSPVIALCMWFYLIFLEHLYIIPTWKFLLGPTAASLPISSLPFQDPLLCRLYTACSFKYIHPSSRP